MLIAKLAKSRAESLSTVLGDESPVEVVEVEAEDATLGDKGVSGRPTQGEGGLDKFDEGGERVLESSVSRARRLPVERFILKGRRSGDESLLLSIMWGERDRRATGVTSPSVAWGVSSLLRACENDVQPSATCPFQLLRRSCPGLGGVMGGDNVAYPPAKTFIKSLSGDTTVGGAAGSCPNASLGGDVGGEGAQYLDNDKCDKTSGRLGATNDSGGGRETGDSGRGGAAWICVARRGNVQ